MLGGKLGSRRRRRRGSATTAVVVVFSVAVVFASGGGASVASGSDTKGKVDKAAVLRVGDDLERGGGPAFDPSNQTQNPVNRQYMELVYDVMIHNSGEPGLASKWTTPDPSTVELTLRKGAKFTDGSPFNAAAVKAAWDRFLAANVPGTPAEIKAFSSVEAVNDNLIRIHLSQPIARKVVNETLRNSNWLGVPSPAAAAAGTLNQKPVGAGPYMFKSRQPGGNIEFTRNPDYWDPKAQKLGGVQFVQVGLGVPSVSALQAGAVDLIHGFDPSAVDTIKGQKGLDVVATPGDRVVDLSLCTNRGVFANKKARQALQYALDRKAINEGALSGTGTPTQTAFTAASPFYDKSLDTTYSFNPKKAKAMLSEAGVAPGTSILGLVSGIVPNNTIAEIVQAQLKDVGVNLTVQVTPNVTTDSARLNPDLNVVGINPSIFSLAFLPNGARALNPCGWTNPELMTAYTDANDGSKTPAEEKAAWKKFQEVLLDESPVVFVVAPSFLAGQSNKVKGVDLINEPAGPPLDTVYKVK